MSRILLDQDQDQEKKEGIRSPTNRGGLGKKGIKHSHLGSARLSGPKEKKGGLGMLERVLNGEKTRSQRHMIYETPTKHGTDRKEQKEGIPLRISPARTKGSFLALKEKILFGLPDGQTKTPTLREREVIGLGFIRHAGKEKNTQSPVAGPG